MKNSSIHPTAIIEDGAIIGHGVVVEAYAIIKKNVVLKDRVQVRSHAYIDGHTTIDEGTVIWPFASIGTKTQDLKFHGETTYVQIGKHCDIREFVTINASCGEGSVVKVGDHCLLMAYCHVAHNCEVGNRVIMANSAMLAGHVIVEDYAIIGGMTPVHQFSRIGRYAMVGGLSRIPNDVPPFTIGGGIPYKMGGLNIVGLKRNRFTLEERKSLFQAFKWTYRSGLPLPEALKKIREEVPLNPHVEHWIQFCETSKRGLIALSGAEFEEAEEEKEELLASPTSSHR